MGRVCPRKQKLARAFKRVALVAQWIEHIGSND